MRRSILIAGVLAAACSGGPEPASTAAAETAPATSDAPLDEVLAELAPDEGELGHNVSLEDPSGEALDALHAALRRAAAGEGQARMLFYGGSHTAGDLYTGRLRQFFQAHFGDAGHGFVPLVPVVGRHWAWAVRIDEAEGFEVRQVGFKRREIDRYGLIGVSYVADEPEAFAAVTSDHWGNGRLASRLALLHDRVPEGGHLEVWLDGRRVETLDTAADPAEGGRRVYEVSDGPHRLEVRAVGDGPVTVFGVTMDRETPGVVVDNLGLVGSKARHQLLWDEALWRGFFVERRPDLIALAYGNNETTDTHLEVEDHEAHLRSLMARLQSAAPGASCLLIGPTDRPRALDDGTLGPRPVVAELTEMQRRVAAEHGCAFFDTLAFMGGLGGGIAWLRHDPPYLQDDRQHLSREGYHRWGEALAHALLEGYEGG
ncbi:MAG TPA: GDSL-type esterase/lipase family protein [Sandaracinaceae bacterium LLY-WYZ-13_1]|nr:GDSL-type esterase/lipase family protein [Sandaracinaceae bacterium LLY-WYZ-13_1]